MVNLHRHWITAESNAGPYEARGKRGRYQEDAYLSLEGPAWGQFWEAEGRVVTKREGVGGRGSVL